MRITITLALFTLTSARVALAAPATPQAPSPWTHTRSLSAGATALIANASERSSIIASLLDDLEQTDLVVYITDAMPWAVSGPASYLTFLSCDDTTRYLLVRLDFWRLSPPERIAWLGHELQHALEVAIAPEVRDAAGLAQLYRRIGWESEKNRFETEGARATGNRVRNQLNVRPAPPARRLAP